MPRQADLAAEAKMQQSRISMFETPGAANLTLDTLSRLAAVFKVGLVVKFVSFSEMLRWEDHYSQDAFDVTRIDRDIEFINPDASSVRNTAAVAPIGNAPAANGKPSVPIAASFCQKRVQPQAASGGIVDGRNQAGRNQSAA